MKTKMKSVLLVVVSFVFALCLGAAGIFGFNNAAINALADGESTLKMEYGAQVRLVENDPGLRFTASISTEEYESVKTANGTFGMFILPNAYRTSVGEINDANAFGAEAKYCWGGKVDGKTQIIHCTTDNLTQTSTDGATTYFACALTNIKPTNYDLQFFATVYYEVNGQRTWAELDEDNVRSVSYVAQKVLGYETLGTYTPSETGKAALVEYVTQFVEVTGYVKGEIDYNEGKQEIDVPDGEMTLNVADADSYPIISIKGTEIDYEVDGNTVYLTGITTGRHVATVEFDDGMAWEIPFVYADHVLRTSADVVAWGGTTFPTVGMFPSAGYTVVANDIKYEGTSSFNSQPNTIGTTTFDGYGHKLTGFNITMYGLLGSGASNVVIKDLAMVDAKAAHFSALVGTFSGTIENVFVSGTGTGTGLFALTVDNANISNCVVIDKGTSQFSMGRISKDKKTNASNNVVVTSGYAIKDLGTSAEAFGTTDVNGEGNVKVDPTDNTALFAALATLAEQDNNWSFDAETGALKLLGNTVYKVAIPEGEVIDGGTLDAQFIKASESGVELAFSGAQVKSVKVDGVAVDEFTFNNNVISFDAVSKNRHTATVVVAGNIAYTIPFVYADHVLRTTDDVIAWCAATPHFTSGGYTVVANDIIFDKDSWINGRSNMLISTTFDGYGHKLIGFKISGFGLFANIAASVVIKDLALVDVEAFAYTALAGTVSGTIENVFVSGKYAGSATGTGLFAMTVDNANISNCVVIEKGTSQYSMGRISKDKKTNASNNVVVTSGYAIKDLGTSVEAFGTADVSGTDNVKLENTTGLAAALKALAAKDNSWTFDEATNTLKLMGKEIYKIS